MGADEMLKIILSKLEGTDTHSELIHTNQAAEILGVKPQTMSLWRHKNIGPDYVKIGSSVRYARAAIVDYIASNTVKV